MNADESQPSEEIIAGRVVDASNQPIAGAKVQWMTDFFQDCVATVSDAEGRFQLRQAVPADGEKAVARENLLWAYADGFNLKCVRPQQRDGRFLPSTVSLSTATEIEVKVLAHDGTPCADALVEPYYFDIPNGIYYSERPTGLTGIIPPSVVNDFRVTTDDKGKASLRGLPLNKLEGLTVRQQDTQPQLFRTHHHELEVVTLQPTGRVVGNIFVANPKAAPLELSGKRVLLMSSGNQSVTCHTWTTVDARGEFAVNGMMAGIISANLAMGDSQYQPYFIPSKRLAAGDELDLEIVVAEAVLVRGRLVTEDTDEPVEKTRIAAFLVGQIGQQQSKDATSDQEGYYTLYLHPGAYQVQAFDMVQSKHASDYSYPPSIHFSLKEGAEEFDAPHMRFPPVQTEIGKLIDSQGKPIANRRVALLNGDSNHPIKRGSSDESGMLKIRTSPRDSQIRDQATRWVLYPKETSAKEGDVRDYPSLRLESDSPLILVSEQPDA